MQPNENTIVFATLLKKKLLCDECLLYTPLLSM